MYPQETKKDKAVRQTNGLHQYTIDSYIQSTNIKNVTEFCVCLYPHNNCHTN